jgi:hypothetical protein
MRVWPRFGLEALREALTSGFAARGGRICALQGFEMPEYFVRLITLWRRCVISLAGVGKVRLGAGSAGLRDADLSW